MTRRARAIGLEALPTVSWRAVESHRIRTTDGEEVGAWFIPGNDRQPAVLLLHGNGDTRGHCVQQAELVASVGCPVLMLTLRAHGDSTGDTNDFGYSARHDVIAAVAWLEERVPGTPVVVWGQSLGSAAALFAAGQLGTRVCGYILECPYQDLHTATRNRTDYYLPPPLSAIAYSGLVLTSSLALPHVDEISPLKAAARMPPNLPCLILAGEADLRARASEARAIQSAIGPQAQLDVFQNGDHLKLHDAEPGRYHDSIVTFVQRFR